MKRKFLAGLLVTVMVFAMTGCGNGTDTSADNSNADTQMELEAESESEIVTEVETETVVTGPIQAVADANGNYIVNGSFEEVDFTGWTVNNVNNATEELDIYTRETDCYEGVQSLHFYSGSNVIDFTAEQSLTGLEAGTYKLTAYCQGDTAGDAEGKIYFYVIVDGETLTVDGQLNGYVNWYQAELGGINVTSGDIIIGVCVQNAAGGWGTIDNITLVKEQ
ncbi:MAG: hypothetical protein IJZ23_01720 [Roseburia sp.]|nr:hypothetical protein [Roseburia sp.]